LSYKPVLLVAVGVVAGLLLSPFANISGKTDLPEATPKFRAPVGYASDTSSDQRVVALTGELEALKAELAAVKSANAPRDPAQVKAEFAARMAAKEREFHAAIRQREVDQLTAAGFSPQRIEWAARRTEELYVQQQQDHEDRKARGIATDAFQGLAYMLDPDLDLVLEMGEDEYDRYRRALGRPDGIVVDSVLATSNADVGGLKPGDEILRYAGKRVYNIGMLDGLASARTTPALVEVKRDGQSVTLTLSKGRVGIRNDNFLSRVAGGEMPVIRQ
jgi:hypothetical protein